MLNSLKQYGLDRSGNVVMIFALALPVIFLAIGGAIDFSRVMQLRKELQDAADVASVGSISVNSMAYKANAKGEGEGSFKKGEKQAKAIFDSNTRNNDDLKQVKFKADIRRDGTNLVSDVQVTANYRPYMLGLIGMDKVPVSVKSSSASTFPPYIDFYLLLDNSPSMGVGATTKDIDKMVANTPDKCAFACHQKDKAGNDYYALAKKLGVTTRIDVVREATQNLMKTAKNTQTLTNQYRVAIYDFGLSAETIDPMKPGPYLISSLTTNLDASATNADKIDLMTIPYQNYNADRQTNFQSTLAGMNKLIPNPGDGSAPSKPQQVLLFVSDGANDGYDCAYSNGASCRRITPLDPAQCTAMKARGIKIAVLYTTYLPLPTNAFYNAHLAKYVTPKSQLAEKMQECASTGLYFEVGPNQGISEALNTLFIKVVSVVRISS